MIAAEEVYKIVVNGSSYEISEGLVGVIALLVLSLLLMVVAIVVAVVEKR